MSNCAMRDFSSPRTLSGGTGQWRRAGGPLEGASPESERPGELEPVVWFSERSAENWTLVDVSRDRKTEADLLLPGTVSVPWTGEAVPFMKQFVNSVRRYRADPVHSILIFNSDGHYDSAMLDRISKRGIPNVFCLRGGLEGYADYLRMQTTILNQAAENRKRVKKCPSCP